MSVDQNLQNVDVSQNVNPRMCLEYVVKSSWQEYYTVEEKMLGCLSPRQDRLPQQFGHVWGQEAPLGPSGGVVM
jgi:hypothetical protein